MNDGTAVQGEEHRARIADEPSGRSIRSGEAEPAKAGLVRELAGRCEALGYSLTNCARNFRRHVMNSLPEAVGLGPDTSGPIRTISVCLKSSKSLLRARSSRVMTASTANVE